MIGGEGRGWGSLCCLGVNLVMLGGTDGLIRWMGLTGRAAADELIGGFGDRFLLFHGRFWEHFASGLDTALPFRDMIILSCFGCSVVAFAVNFVLVLVGGSVLVYVSCVALVAIISHAGCIFLSILIGFAPF